MDQNVAVPTVFDSLRRVPFAARVVFDILQRPDYVAPRQSCNNLLHKWPVQVCLRERARVLKGPGRQPCYVSENRVASRSITGDPYPPVLVVLGFCTDAPTEQHQLSIDGQHRLKAVI